MRGGDERGQALIETILVGLILLIPIVWALGVLADLHRGALASNAAARDAGLAAARSTDLAGANAAVHAMVERAFEDHGLDPDDARVRWTASSGLERGGLVEIEVSYPVTVVQAPLIGRVAGPSIWINARHAGRIDPFRSRQ
jgi:hypothetical protein